MPGKRHAQVVNLDEIDPLKQEHGSRFALVRKRLGAAAGGQELGASWFEVPPGKQAFPHHAHFNNEEAVFVLSGAGELRLGDQRMPIAAGDYLAFPAGAESAHSIINTGTTPLQYLGISTAHRTDICIYPDSRKFAAVGGANMHQGLGSAGFRKLLKDQPDVDYYLDED